MICLLGGFRLVAANRPVAVRTGGKVESFLGHLALRAAERVPRDVLLQALWPDADASLAVQSLHSLVYSLHKQLRAALDGQSPVLHEGGGYRLNAEAGVDVDVAYFDRLAEAGEQHARAGDVAGAADLFTRAVRLYRGDLGGGADIHAMVERERVRAVFLRLLARLAETHYEAGDDARCLEHAMQLLAVDPCREDAHRILMCCYVRQGERAQALRQYRLCETILRTEYDAYPEPATRALFDRIRTDPSSV